MNYPSQISPSNSKRLDWIRLLAIALLVLGLIFRLTHLASKVYWHDEAYTSMVITGRPGRYLTESLFQNKLVKPSDLLAYQQFTPDVTLQEMLVRKGLEDGQHPPLYYVLLRFWAQLWGTHPAILRGFSAGLSLLVLPAVYGLCLELFESPLCAWIALCLFAVSPIHLVYAQEAREFGTWTGLGLLSSFLLLRAMRSPTRLNWLGYTMSMVVGLYTSLFSLVLALGHGLYVWMMDPDLRLRPLQLGQRTRRAGMAFVGMGILFLPWIGLMGMAVANFEQTTSWTAISLPWVTNLQLAVFNFSRSFVDFNWQLNDPVAYAIALPLLLFQGYALFQVWQTAPRRVVWFLFPLIGTTALLLGLPDLLLGGQRFTVNRYLLLCFIGLHLAVVYTLATWISAIAIRKRLLATVIFSLLLILGVTSCGVYTQANTWWNKSLNSNYHQIATLINRSDHPLVVTDSFAHYAASTVALSYLLQPEVQLLLLPPVGSTLPIQVLPQEARTIFLMNLPAVFRQQFAARFQQKLSLVFQDPWNEIWESQPQRTERAIA